MFSEICEFDLEFIFHDVWENLEKSMNCEMEERRLDVY